jgi:hypothetical protein
MSATSQPSAVDPLQLAKPGWHSIAHETPLQLGTAFAPVGHGEQLVPQVAGLESLAQALPQAWKSAWHVKPHAPEAHVDWPFGTAGQAVPQAPQLSRDDRKSTH